MGSKVYVEWMMTMLMKAGPRPDSFFISRESIGRRGTVKVDIGVRVEKRLVHYIKAVAAHTLQTTNIPIMRLSC
jgi:hypothetical protein